jgi:rhamnose transport system substrate-binding protein/rhamnose transport system permease protein
MTKGKQEIVLALLIACEIALFSVTGQNFFSLGNFLECIRLGVEIGLLSLALTPVIVTGGIDLSVGSMMGLCAVSFGWLWHDAGVPTGAAVLLALVISLLGGALNGTLIARLNVSPLIVTLGTYSLFRGLAEGITMGSKNYSGVPSGFLFLGQGYLGGVVPAQTVFLVGAIVGFWLLLHRSVVGRALYAIGHGLEGARYAAIPVKRRIGLVYLLSGLASGVAAIVYVAHLGQAKSDAGTGYELIAITAVVLGGTSIFGGSGSIGGTLLGLVAIVVLQNGLRLSGWPAELAGILTGVLLAATIALERAGRRGRLIMAAIVAAGAVVLGISVAAGHAGVAGTITIGVMPKAKGDPYFISCRAGAEEAAKQLHVNLIWDGPTGLDAAKQNEVIEGWITRHVDAISVSVENAAGISTVLRKARAQGIKVTTWDADAEANARDYFINQATPEAIGNTLIDETARVMHGSGEFAIITGALSAANQNIWISFMRQRVKEKYPGLKLVTVRPSDDDRDKAFEETQTLVKVYPNIKTIVGISAPAVPGAGEAVKQSGRQDVQVIGLSLPNLCKPYVHGGSIEAVVLWNTKDLGYLAVWAPAALARGTLRAGQGTLKAGRLGAVKIEGDQIILGAPVIFRKDNIDQFNF